MFSVPEGRAANQPLSVTTFSPPIGAPLPGAEVSLAVIGSPARVSVATAVGRQLLQPRFLIRGRWRIDARVVWRTELSC